MTQACRKESSPRPTLKAGVKEGGRQVEEFVSDNNINRVILLSDGLANVGPSTPGELAELGRKLASKGISVSTLSPICSRVGSTSERVRAWPAT